MPLEAVTTLVSLLNLGHVDDRSTTYVLVAGRIPDEVLDHVLGRAGADATALAGSLDGWQRHLALDRVLALLVALPLGRPTERIDVVAEHGQRVGGEDRAVVGHAVGPHEDVLGLEPAGFPGQGEGRPALGEFGRVEDVDGAERGRGEELRDELSAPSCARERVRAPG
jgi:hypothetical protein